MVWNPDHVFAAQDLCLQAVMETPHDILDLRRGLLQKVQLLYGSETFRPTALKAETVSLRFA